MSIIKIILKKICLQAGMPEIESIKEDICPCAYQGCEGAKEMEKFYQICTEKYPQCAISNHLNTYFNN